MPTTTPLQLFEEAYPESDNRTPSDSPRSSDTTPDNSTELNNPAIASPSPASNPPIDSILADRLLREAKVEDDPTAITAHRLNYLLPYSYVSGLNRQPFDLAEENNSFEHNEAKFQFSIKVALAKDLLFRGDRLQFAFTTLSFWQVYDRDNSAPFRENNYEPELFWQIPFEVTLFSRSIYVAGLGISHQSNGQTVPLSRSWNRIFTNLTWDKGDWVFQLKPWWRIPETESADSLSAKGDDNPDIEDYMGHFEFITLLKNHRNELAFTLRNNLDSDNNRGALQIDWTFPLNNRLRGYVQGFNGYGESLIDYNVNITRVGFGIVLADWL